MEGDEKVLVIVPTYNERENLRLLVGELLALPIPVQVLVVDDNSPDGTGEIADGLAEAHPDRVYVLHRTGKLGLGTAYIAGFRWGLERGMRWLCTMDADFSHHPRYIPQMLRRAREGADLVIGSRYVPGGEMVDCTLVRRLLSWGANAFARMVLGLRAHDCTAGFRCYRREVLESIDLGAIFSEGYSFLIEMLYKCQRLGWRVAEVPIVFENRRQGVSKISRQEVLRALYTVARLGMERMLHPGRLPQGVRIEGKE